jgi:hypothetical protein
MANMESKFGLDSNIEKEKDWEEGYLATKDDGVHVSLQNADEGAQLVLGATVTPEEAQRLLSKIDWHLVCVTKNRFTNCH